MLPKKYLKFASFNVEGLRSKLDDNNFKREISKHDFITLVETWLPPDEQVHFEGRGVATWTHGRTCVPKKLLKKGNSGFICTVGDSD